MRKVDVEESADTWELSARLYSSIARLFRALREKSSDHQPSLSHISLLTRLEREGSSTVTELARAEGMRPQSMSATMADLDAAGLVSGVPDPADGRRTILSLTEAGRAAVRGSRVERQDWLTHRIGARLSPTERKQLIAAMELLERLV